jgi:hypothetical protein
MAKGDGSRKRIADILKQTPKHRRKGLLAFYLKHLRLRKR